MGWVYGSVLDENGIALLAFFDLTLGTTLKLDSAWYVASSNLPQGDISWAVSYSAG